VHALDRDAGLVAVILGQLDQRQLDDRVLAPGGLLFLAGRADEGDVQRGRADDEQLLLDLLLLQLSTLEGELEPIS
jgi:hypothetical protein